MEVAPQVEMKPFADCKPGELVRILWDGKCCLSLVTAREQPRQRCLIVLSGEGYPEGALPRYAWVGNSDFSIALSYGQDHTMEVDHNGPVEIGSGGKLWDKAGTIMLADGSWRLYVPPFKGQRGADGGSLPPLHLDLSDWTGQFGFHDNRTVASFGKWAIHPKRPEGAAERPPALFTYVG